MSDLEITNRIIQTQSYQELIQVLRDLEQEEITIVSLTRGADKPKLWSVDKIITRVNYIRNGSFINMVTRANGIRAKIAEFILADNYGDGWELK